MLDAGGEMVGAAIGLGVLKVEALGCSRAVVGVEASFHVSVWFAEPIEEA